MLQEVLSLLPRRRFVNLTWVAFVGGIELFAVGAATTADALAGDMEQIASCKPGRNIHERMGRRPRAYTDRSSFLLSFFYLLCFLLPQSFFVLACCACSVVYDSSRVPAVVTTRNKRQSANHISDCEPLCRRSKHVGSLASAACSSCLGNHDSIYVPALRMCPLSGTVRQTHQNPLNGSELRI